MKARPSLDRTINNTIQINSDDLASLKDFSNQLWFVNSLFQKDLIINLNFIEAPQRVIALKHLLYAYAHPGTREAICHICKAFFGDTAEIDIDDDIPMLVNIKIKNANFNFFRSYYDGDNFAVLNDEKMAKAIRDLSGTTTTDPREWFKLFLPPEVVLGDLNITEER